MKQTRMIPNVVALLDGLCKNRLVRDTMKLFSLIREKGIIPKVVIYTTVVDAFYKTDKLDDVTRILELVGAEPKPWATLVEAIMRAPPSEAMLRVWRRKKRGGGE
jgi:pentatricopeptide repeat protein